MSSFVPAEVLQLLAVVERPSAGGVHGVALIVPAVGAVLGPRNGIDLDGQAVEGPELGGVVPHRLQHGGAQADAAAGGDAIGGPGRRKGMSMQFISSLL